MARRSISRRPIAPAGTGCLPRAGSDTHDPDGIGAAYLEMPDFDRPREFLTRLAAANITGEHRPHAIRFARRPAASG